MMLARIFRQPLLHFLVLGALIFLAYTLSEEGAVVEEPSDRQIVVDRAALLDYLQYQAQAFAPERFAERLDAMSEAEVAALAAAYAREEALYREGLRMGLDRADYDIRQRVVQKVEFLLENLVAAAVVPTDAELQAFFDARNTAYRSDAVYSFTHIFFDGADDMAQARTSAETLLADAADIAFEQSAQYGDPYPFLQNYVERTRSFVASNFSADFVDQLDSLAPGETWQGPLQSRYGWHLVMLRARRAELTPALADVRARVLDDYRRASLLRERETAEARVIADYDIVLQLE